MKKFIRSQFTTREEEYYKEVCDNIHKNEEEEKFKEICKLAEKQKLRDEKRKKRQQAKESKNIEGLKIDFGFE